MELKFPLESDFGKYFLYDLYLKTLAEKGNEEKTVLEHSDKFNQCLNLNRQALRGYNCGERKKAIDEYFSTNQEKFTEFKDKLGDQCNSQISKYLSNYYYSQSTYADSNLYERISSEALLDNYLIDIKNCLN